MSTYYHASGAFEQMYFKSLGDRHVTDHKRFYFQRNEDVSGISGTGRVADGVLWVDGSVSIRWRGECGSFENWDQFVKAVNIHGHEGKTAVVWLDQPEPSQEWYDE